MARFKNNIGKSKNGNRYRSRGEFLDFTKKKSIHISTMSGVHTSFKVVAGLHSLSMQEIINEFMLRISLEDPSSMKIVHDLVEQKRSGESMKLSERDIDDIYDLIASAESKDRSNE